MPARGNSNHLPFSSEQTFHRSPDRTAKKGKLPLGNSGIGSIKPSEIFRSGVVKEQHVPTFALIVPNGTTPAATIQSP